MIDQLLARLSAIKIDRRMLLNKQSSRKIIKRELDGTFNTLMPQYSVQTRAQPLGDTLSSDECDCFADTVSSSSQGDVVHHLSCHDDHPSPCTSSLNKLTLTPSHAGKGRGGRRARVGREIGRGGVCYSSIYIWFHTYVWYKKTQSRSNNIQKITHADPEFETAASPPDANLASIRSRQPSAPNTRSMSFCRTDGKTVYLFLLCKAAGKCLRLTPATSLRVKTKT